VSFGRWEIVRCSCGGCMGPQQILRIKKRGRQEPIYKVAYYNSFFGGRHWVTGKQLSYL
jgi:hypothetical protein